uniref:Acidic protein n=1 Tax=Triticum urartu TaxID=4572 RepID=A0A8R7UR25_TRIUA
MYITIFCMIICFCYASHISYLFSTGCYIPKEDSSSKNSSLNGSCTKKCLGVQVLCENDAPAVFWKNGKITWMSDCKHVGHCLCGPSLRSYSVSPSCHSLLEWL